MNLRFHLHDFIMKCNRCNDLRSQIRCEGCQVHFCIPCMNQHHEELVIQLNLLADVHQGLKSSFNQLESTWQQNTDLSCFRLIDRWEEEMIERVQKVANHARNTADEILAKNLIHLRHRLDQISFDVRNQNISGDYLEKDIAMSKAQLELLSRNIDRFYDSIQVNYSMTDKIDWNLLLRVTSASSFLEEPMASIDLESKKKFNQQKIWSNLYKFTRIKHLTTGKSSKSITITAHRNADTESMTYRSDVFSRDQYTEKTWTSTTARPGQITKNKSKSSNTLSILSSESDAIDDIRSFQFRTNV